MQRLVQNSNIHWVDLSFLVCLSVKPPFISNLWFFRPLGDAKRQQILFESTFPWLIETVPSQENLRNRQNARWTVSRTRTMQLTTRSLNPCSVSLQSLPIYLSEDCRKADYFRLICSQLTLHCFLNKPLKTPDGANNSGIMRNLSLQWRCVLCDITTSCFHLDSRSAWPLPVPFIVNASVKRNTAECE